MPRRSPLLPSFVSRPEPIHAATVTLAVAFRDCDPMGVLWHGNYLAYCEAAREALDARIGVGVRHLRDLGLFAPVVRSQVFHQVPLRPGEDIAVTAELFATRQPRLYHRYRITRDGVVAAEAETEQVLTDRSFALLLAWPEALQAVCDPGDCAS